MNFTKLAIAGLLVIPAVIRADAPFVADPSPSGMVECLRQGEVALAQYLSEFQNKCQKKIPDARAFWLTRICPFLVTQSAKLTLYRSPPKLIVTSPSDPPSRSVDVEYYWPEADVIIGIGIWNGVDAYTGVWKGNNWCSGAQVIREIPLKSSRHNGTNVLDEKAFMAKATTVLLDLSVK